MVMSRGNKEGGGAGRRWKQEEVAWGGVEGRGRGIGVRETDSLGDCSWL